MTIDQDLETEQRSIDALMPPVLVMLREILTGMLGAHNDKEEAILYRAAVEVLDRETQETIANALVDEVVPQGWRCEMAA